MNYLLKSSCSNSEKVLKTEKSKIYKNKNNKIKDYNYKNKIYEQNLILIPNQKKPNKNFDYKNILLEPKRINSPKKTKQKREISIKNNCLSARKLLKENHLINNIKAKNEFFSLEKYLSSSTITLKKKKNNFFINEDTYDLLKTSFSSSEKILKTEKSKIFNNNNCSAKNKNTKDFHLKNKNHKNNYLFFSGQKKIKYIQNNNALNYKKTIQNSQKILHTISNKTSNKIKFVFNENFIVDRCIDIIKKNFDFIEKETENFKNNTNKIKQKFLFINIYKNKK